MPKSHTFPHLSTVILEDPCQFPFILEKLGTIFNESRVLATLVLADIGLRSVFNALMAAPNLHVRRLGLPSRHFHYYEGRTPWDWKKFTMSTWHVRKEDVRVASASMKLTHGRQMRVALLDAQMSLIRDEARKQNKINPL
jgi:hypothetical protein